MASFLDKLLGRQDEDAPIPLNPGADPSLLTSSPMASPPMGNTPLTPEQLANFQIPPLPQDPDMPSMTPASATSADPSNPPMQTDPARVPAEDESDAEDFVNASGKSLAAKNQSKSPNAQSMADVLFPQGVNPQDTLRDAIHDRDTSQLVNNLGKSAELIGTGFSRGTPVATQQFNDNIKAADSKLQGVKDLQANEENDPNSAASKGYQDFLKRYGVNAPGATAAQIKGVLLPAAFKDQEQKERLQAHREEMYQRALDRKALMSSKNEDKKLKADTDRVDKAGKLVTSEIASSRSPFGKAANAYQNAEKIEQMVQNIDPNDLDNRQIAELARNLDGMLSNGQATVSGMEHLLPKSASGDASKIAEYISSLPKGAEQGEFVTRMMETVRREKQLSHEQMGRTQKNLLSSYSDLKDNKQMKDMLAIRGIPDDIFDPANKKQSAQPTAVSMPKSAPPPPSPSGTTAMTKDGITYKAIPNSRIEEAKSHGYR